MRSDVPKVLHAVLGQPLLEYVVQAARQAGAERVIAVVSPDHREAIAEALAGYPEVELALQVDPKGTGHAVLCAAPLLEDFQGTTLVMLGDAPCVSPASLEALLEGHRERSAQVSVLSGTVADPHGYGRIVRGPDHELSLIVEEKDASPALRKIAEINSGLFALELPRGMETLKQLSPSPETGELYMTQIVELARSEGLRVCAVNAAREEDVLGVNDRIQLAQVQAILRQRINHAHMQRGVTIVDPNSAFIDARAEIEQDARIEPFVVIQGPCKIGRGAVVGPFSHLRGGSRLGVNSRVGNFVEVVRSHLGDESRALHLSYIGDATLGREANVGAGTVFANWDGKTHQQTTLGAQASLGANTVLVAPSQLGEGSRTGAGAVVVKGELASGSTWVGVPARPLESAHQGEGVR